MGGERGEGEGEGGRDRGGERGEGEGEGERKRERALWHAAAVAEVPLPVDLTSSGILLSRD